ncbi:MAG: nucleotidyltransferase domain-containing protein [Deltaproteobacteria bacterium]|nr:nucleotidyltransferase domain-containing protein [Deltaproteobacteria bacterium]
MQATSALEQVLPPGARLVVLFGSHGTARTRPDSDVDLLVGLDADTPDLRFATAAALSAHFARDVDVVFTCDAGPLLAFEVARTGRLLLERDPGAWHRFKVRAIIDWWDWQPTASSMHAAFVARLRQHVERAVGA